MSINYNDSLFETDQLLVSVNFAEIEVTCLSFFLIISQWRVRSRVESIGLQLADTRPPKHTHFPQVPKSSPALTLPLFPGSVYSDLHLWHRFSKSGLLTTGSLQNTCTWSMWSNYLHDNTYSHYLSFHCLVICTDGVSMAGGETMGAFPATPNRSGNTMSLTSPPCNL